MISQKTLLAGVVLGAGACVLMLPALPQGIGLVSQFLTTPYTVDSVFVRYSNDGLPTVDMYSTSYYTGGREIRLSSAIPGNSFLTAIRQMIDTTSFIWFRLKEGFRANTEEMRAGGNDVTPGNGCAAGPVVGRETILGYPTVAIQWSGSADGRITVWQSPDLSCFPLKLRYERRFPDGNFHLLIERLALKVNKLQVQKAS